MNDSDSVNYEIVLIATGTTVILLMALFSVSFILFFHRRQRQTLLETQALQQAFERELLQTQLETQNHTLQHIAQELHDHIGQLLTVALMRLNSLEEDVKDTDAQWSVQQTQNIVNTIITDVRALAKTLDYDTVSRFGLLPSITHELERIQRTGRIQTNLQTIGEPYALGEQTEMVLLRMAQESLNNALKHARARMLTIVLDFQSDQFHLTVADDGRGFQVGEVSGRLLEQAGSGLANLQRRASMLGGNCTVDSEPDAGTRIQITIPRPLSFQH